MVWPCDNHAAIELPSLPVSCGVVICDEVSLVVSKIRVDLDLSGIDIGDVWYLVVLY